MKVFLTALILVWAALVPAQSVTLAWTGSTSAGLAGYRVYAGTNSGVYVFSVAVGLATNRVLSLPRNGRWYFTATAIDTNGIESKFSNEVAWEAKPEPPVLHGETWVRLTPVIECSTNLVDWRSVAGEPVWFCATNSREFFTTRQLLIERVVLADGPSGRAP